MAAVTIVRVDVLSTVVLAAPGLAALAVMRIDMMSMVAVTGPQLPALASVMIGMMVMEDAALTIVRTHVMVAVAKLASLIILRIDGMWAVRVAASTLAAFPILSFARMIVMVHIVTAIVAPAPHLAVLT